MSLSIANRMLAREGVLDAFGHVSLRHPGDPSRYFLARSLAPEAVTEDDILEFDLASEPVEPFSGMLYSERVIDSFTDAEIDLAGKFPEASLSRAWNYWYARLEARSS
jgi:hypothetical protein